MAERKSKFSGVAGAMRGGCQQLLKSTVPCERWMEVEIASSNTLAAEIHDLDYVLAFCQSMETICRLERDRKYRSYLAAKERESS